MSKVPANATLKRRAKEYQKAKKALLKEYELQESPDLNFPRYREYPNDLKLALMVLESHGGVFITRFVDTKEPTKKGKK